MNSVETFFAGNNTIKKDDKHYTHPVCRRLERRYERLLSEVSHETLGTFGINEWHALSELRIMRVTGLGEWLPGSEDGKDTLVLIKNPAESHVVGHHLGYGARNGIFLDEKSGLVFTGEIVEGNTLYTRRPVIEKYQEQFRTALEGLGQAVLPRFHQSVA